MSTTGSHWQDLHDKFAALEDEENRIGNSYRLCAYGDYDPPAGSYGRWALGHSPSEYFTERFRLYATEAGSLLNCPYDIPQSDYWLHRLWLELRQTESAHVSIGGDDGGLIQLLCRASAQFCIILRRQDMEESHLGKTDFMALEISRVLQSEVRKIDGPPPLPLEAQMPLLVPQQSIESEPVKVIMTVAEELEALRLECDLTQQQLSDELVMELRTVQRHLSGESQPTRRAIQRYRQYFLKRLKRNVLQIIRRKMP